MGGGILSSFISVIVSFKEDIMLLLKFFQSKIAGIASLILELLDETCSYLFFVANLGAISALVAAI